MNSLGLLRVDLITDWLAKGRLPLNLAMDCFKSNRHKIATYLFKLLRPFISILANQHVSTPSPVSSIKYPVSNPTFAVCNCSTLPPASLLPVAIA